MEREKCYYKWFSKYFEKINRNVENENSVDYIVTSKETVFNRSSHWKCYVKKAFLEILQNS